MIQTSAGIPSEVRERIVSVAAELFEQSGRQAMPTVDAVRRVARVDMNAASTVMREWRRAQTAQATQVAVSVPEVVQQASSVALATIWLQAQELANESLRSAQAAWELERGELDAMRKELAEAFERQAGELDAAGVALEAQKLASVQQGQELAGVRLELGEALSRTDKAEARIAEIELRAAELRSELDRAHADVDRLHGECDQVREKAAAEVEAAQAAADTVRVDLVKLQAKAEAIEQAHAAQSKQAGADLHQAVERITQAQTEREDAAKAAAEARERAAGLAGQLQAVQEHNAALLAVIKPQAQSLPGLGAKP